MRWAHRPRTSAITAKCHDDEASIQPGDVLIWHAQLLHGGAPILHAGETRTSLVTHYWTVLDFPEPADQVDLGNGRLILKRQPQRVIDKAPPDRVRAYLATLPPNETDRAAVPNGFDAFSYLLRNADVMEAGADPYGHYVHHGRREGRTW